MPLDILRALQTDVILLYGLHNAMRYHYDILPGIPQQWEMENMVNFSLRLTLQALDQD